MSLRLVEVHVPPSHIKEFQKQLEDFSFQSYWIEKEADGRTLFRILFKNDKVEEILNDLEEISNIVDGFETILIPVHAYFSKESVKSEREKKQESAKVKRASRHELLTTVKTNSRITWNYSLLIVLSAIVATVGFIKDSEAVVIGAMVIAPMIGPVISIAFTSVLGDYKLLSKSALTLLGGVGGVVMISVFFAAFTHMELETNQYLSRTKVEVADIILGVASGAAGSLAFLNRLSGNLVGVMVAVALLPPSVALGFSMGNGDWNFAYGAFLLVTVNIMSILLAAVIIFSVTGIRPVLWKEVQKANVSRPLSFIFVFTIILILAVLIVISGGEFNL
ncbi:TIGR00341 family protein [Halobacillus massiliensis]|uniref:TIGR00341 family protein n=1 Tax=Halobacillus massiliensis TaxID=1926286 RepID=UPI0009E1CCBB|nr:TIGR00341 family protein [Halobacillus massiliensis]